MPSPARAIRGLLAVSACARNAASAVGGRYRMPASAVLAHALRASSGVDAERSLRRPGSPTSRQNSRRAHRRHREGGRWNHGADAAALMRALSKNLLARRGSRVPSGAGARFPDLRRALRSGYFVSRALARWACCSRAFRAMDFGALTAVALPGSRPARRLSPGRLAEFRRQRLAPLFAVALRCRRSSLSTTLGALQDLPARPYLEILDWAFLAWALAVLVRAQYVLTGWRGRLRRSRSDCSRAFRGPSGNRSGRRGPLGAAGDDKDERRGTLTQEVFHRQGDCSTSGWRRSRPSAAGVADLYFIGGRGGRPDRTPSTSEVASIGAARRALRHRREVGRFVNNPASLTEQPIATVGNPEGRARLPRQHHRHRGGRRPAPHRHARR